MFYVSDSPPRPVSQQQFVDCTVGLEAGTGTELARSNQGCDSGFPDLHLKYVGESGASLSSPEEYPLSLTAGTCQAVVTYYGYEDYNQINRQGPVSVTDYQYKYFSTEDDLLQMIQSGPVVTNVDVGPAFQFYAGGVFYDEERCVNYVNEPVPQECRVGASGYTCLGDCKHKLPDHCDR